MSNTYNGWTNRETWLINIWFNPESRADVQAARETFERTCDEAPAFLRDFVSMDVNWQELEDAFAGDEDADAEDQSTESTS